MSYYCDLKDFCFYHNNKNAPIQAQNIPTIYKRPLVVQPLGIDGWGATAAQSTGDNSHGSGISEYQTQSNGKKLLPVYKYVKNNNTIFLVFNSLVKENYQDVNFEIDLTRNNMMTEYFVPVQSSLNSTLFGYIWTREYNN